MNSTSLLSCLDEDFLKSPRYFLSEFRRIHSIQACIFGGALRDSLLGFRPKDIDILVDSDMTESRMNEIIEWLQGSGILRNNTVCRKDSYTYASLKLLEFRIKGITFSDSNEDYIVQLIPLRSFPIYDHLYIEECALSEIATHIPTLSCNRISCSESGEIYYDEGYFDFLENRNIGVYHTINSAPDIVANRIERFYITRGLKPDCSAVEFYNTVVPWGPSFFEGIKIRFSSFMDKMREDECDQLYPGAYSNKDVRKSTVENLIKDFCDIMERKYG